MAPAAIIEIKFQRIVSILSQSTLPIASALHSRAGQGEPGDAGPVHFLDLQFKGAEVQDVAHFGKAAELVGDPTTGRGDVLLGERLGNEVGQVVQWQGDRKSTRLNPSHVS